MSDEMVRAVLSRLNSTHALPCGNSALMFNWAFDTDVITLRASSSRAHVVRFQDTQLLDYLGGVNEPITDEMVSNLLCKMYEKPEDYGLSGTPN